jgi:branched-subunit amino acid aminotransferase/4-amino-4-deoxychorismate lyase
MSGAFDLLETIRWTPGHGFFLLDRHLDRIARSARHFGYACDTARLRESLDRAVISSAEPLRLRLLVSRDGTARVERAILTPPASPARVTLARAPIDPANAFLYHKTTNRKVYEDVKPPGTDSGVDDVILWNPDRQVTESTIANIVIEIGGRKLTPPVECGLLAGTFRGQLIEDGEVEVGIVSVDQLGTAIRLWLVNSVRGWWPAALG